MQVDITANDDDGTFAYYIFITTDLKPAANVTLNIRGEEGFPAVFTFPVSLENASDNGGDVGTFTAEELQAGLAAAGAQGATELVPVIQFADSTGLAGPFKPAFTVDA